MSESQYSGGGGSEVQSHLKLHFEFKVSLETQGILSQRKVYIVCNQVCKSHHPLRRFASRSFFHEVPFTDTDEHLYDLW